MASPAFATPGSSTPTSSRSWRPARRDGQTVSLIMLDVDQFKEFNDTHGHPAGDEALRVLGHTIRSGVRASDVTARYGGEEFIIALHDTERDGRDRRRREAAPVDRGR